jgi:hypothetical protein
VNKIGSARAKLEGRDGRGNVDLGGAGHQFVRFIGANETGEKGKERKGKQKRSHDDGFMISSFA